MSVVVSILASLLVLGILVAVHEGGHFVAGKLLGFKINEFAIGMGPKLISKEKNGTVYCLRAFPIGGMCAFEGEDEETKVDGAFNTFPAWKRFIVAFAGPFMNIVLAFVLAAILLAIFGQYKQVQTENPIITEFTSDTAPAIAAGIEAGDIVIAVNGKAVATADEMIKEIRADEDGDIKLTVDRAGENSYYTINGKKVSLDVDLEKFAKEHSAVAYTLTLENPETLDIIVYDTYNKEAGNNLIGASISTTAGGFDAKYNVLTAIPASGQYVVDIMRQMYEFLGSLFKGGVKMQDMSGIVGVVDVVNDGVSTVIEEESFSAGAKISYIIEFIFYLAVLLSINLGIINLLPLPALDGGRIVFNIIEMITWKPVPQKVEGWIHTVGLFLLLGLIAVITIKDVVFLFR